MEILLQSELGYLLYSDFENTLSAELKSLKDKGYISYTPAEDPDTEDEFESITLGQTAGIYRAELIDAADVSGGGTTQTVGFQLVDLAGKPASARPTCGSLPCHRRVIHRSTPRDRRSMALSHRPTNQKRTRAPRRANSARIRRTSPRSRRQPRSHPRSRPRSRSRSRPRSRSRSRPVVVKRFTTQTKARAGHSDIVTDK